MQTQQTLQPQEIAAIGLGILFVAMLWGNILYGIWEDWQAERKERGQDE